MSDRPSAHSSDQCGLGVCFYWRPKSQADVRIGVGVTQEEAFVMPAQFRGFFQEGGTGPVRQIFLCFRAAVQLEIKPISTGRNHAWHIRRRQSGDDRLVRLLLGRIIPHQRHNELDDIVPTGTRKPGIVQTRQGFLQEHLHPWLETPQVPSQLLSVRRIVQVQQKAYITVAEIHVPRQPPVGPFPPRKDPKAAEVLVARPSISAPRRHSAGLSTMRPIWTRGKKGKREAGPQSKMCS